MIPGPGMVNTDAALFKQTRIPKISEQFMVEFRAEFFNLFNHPNFLPPGRNNSPGVALYAGANSTGTGGIPASTAGVLSTGLPERQIQFGLKFIF